MFLQFSTGQSTIHSLNTPMIYLGFTSEEKVLPEAAACASTFMIPLGNKTKEDFDRHMITALELGYEGYGNY